MHRCSARAIRRSCTEHVDCSPSSTRPNCYSTSTALVRVTEAVVARSAAFRFLVPTVGLSVVPKAGTPIAQDGDHVWATPYDDAVLVMPGMRNLKPGGTAVRLGRFEG